MARTSPSVFICPGKNPDPAAPKNQLFARIAHEHGFSAEILDFTRIEDPEDRIRKVLSSRASQCEQLILVGISMGGYVAAVSAESLPPKGLFLLSPALYVEPYQNLDPRPKAKRIAVVHGIQDQIIPVQNASRFAEKFSAELHLLEGDHSLIPHLPLIGDLFGYWLNKSQAPNPES